MLHTIHSLDRAFENTDPATAQQLLQAALNAATRQGVQGEGMAVKEETWFGAAGCMVSKENGEYNFNNSEIFTVYPTITPDTNVFIPASNNKYYKLVSVQKDGDTYNYELVIGNKDEQGNFTPVTTITSDNVPEEYQLDIDEIVYDYLREYYDNQVYGSDEQVYKTIIIKLFDSVCSEICGGDCEDAKMYIPGNYVFKYTYSTLNPIHIYFNNEPIPVNVIDFDNDLTEYDNNLHHILFKCSEHPYVEHVINYDFTVNYSEVAGALTPIFDSFECFPTYLPYINEDGYWVVNNKETSIYAKGKNAGNPNITIVKSISNEEYKIVSPQSEQFLIQYGDEENTNKVGFTWDPEAATIDPEKIMLNLDPNGTTENTSNNDITIGCWVPNIINNTDVNFDEIKTFLENCIILNISTADCITDSKTKDRFEEYYGNNGVVTTIWMPKFENNQIEFVCVENNEGTAIDFDYLANTSNIVKWWVENHVPKPADKYTFTSLVFDEVNGREKQNSTPEEHIYPVIRNHTGAEYQTHYNNDYNLGIEYCNLSYNLEDNEAADAYFMFKKHYEIGHDYYFKHNVEAFDLLAAEDLPSTSKTYHNYIPDYDIPTMDLGEILLRNTHVVNRLNILNYDIDKNYYSYIGCSYDSFGQSKNSLTIGSSTTDFDMGTNTMINQDLNSNDANRYSFNNISEMYINMDNTRINGYTYIRTDLIAEGDLITHNTLWYKEEIPSKDIILWSTHYLPRGLFFKIENTTLATVNLNTNEHGIDKLDEAFEEVTMNNYMFVPCTIPEVFNNHVYQVYYFDGIYLPELLHRIGLHAFVNGEGHIETGTQIKSNMNIYKLNGIPYILQTTNQLLNVDYQEIEDTKTITLFDGDDDLYTGNMLDISYYISNDNLNITINEVMPNDIITYAKIINTEYSN